MQFKVLLQYIYRFGIVIVFVVLLCLVNHGVLVLSNCTDATLVQTALDRRVVVLRKRRPGLPVEQVPGRVLFQELARFYLLRRFIQ